MKRHGMNNTVDNSMYILSSNTFITLNTCPIKASSKTEAQPHLSLELGVFPLY